MKVGQTIDGQWIISETMGRGGQGEVFKVTDSIDSCFYALKFLNKQSDEERRQRMFMEVCNVKHLSDRHLMNITYSNAEKYKDLSEKPENEKDVILAWIDTGIKVNGNEPLMISLLKRSDYFS